MDAVLQRQEQKREGDQVVATAARAEREAARAIRRAALIKLLPSNTGDAFCGQIPEYVDPAAAAAVVAPAGAAPNLMEAAANMAIAKNDKGKGKGKSSKKGGGKVVPKAQPAKKESTKLKALQYQKPGEKPKGLKGWMKELDARGWSKKKTAIVRHCCAASTLCGCQRASTTPTTSLPRVPPPRMRRHPPLRPGLRPTPRRTARCV